MQTERPPLLPSIPPFSMRPFSTRLYKSSIAISLAALVLQAGQAYSATTTVVLVDKQGSDYYPSNQDPDLPHLFVYRDGSPTEKYAGLFSGKVGTKVDSNPAVYESSTTYFFCMDFFQSVPLAVSTTYNETVISGTSLTAKQQCLLEKVYADLGVTTAVRWFTDGSTAQDLSGTTTVLANPLYGLSDAKAAAAQLLMWEIIHDFSSITSTTVLNTAGMLTSGSMSWFKDYDTNNNKILFSGSDQIYTEFNSLAGNALTLCPVPEITSPVALIFGGLLFIRRREPRRARLKKCGNASSQEIALTA